MTQCIDCERLNLKQAGALARHGFGRCQLRLAHEHVSITYDRECQNFRPAPPAVSEKRREYFAQRAESAAPNEPNPTNL